MVDTSTRSRRAPKRSAMLLGGSAAARAEREEKFVTEYLLNGRNGTQAAIAAGYSPRAAHTQAYKLLQVQAIRDRIAEVDRKAQDASGLTVERTLREVSRIAYNDPRRFFADDGTLVPPSQWDDVMAAAVSSIEVVTRGIGGEADDELDAQPHGGALARKRNPKVEYIHKIKFWDKVQALDKAMKHLGQFERDNRQRADNLAIQINLVGAPVNAAQEIEVQANLVKPNGHNGNGHAP